MSPRTAHIFFRKRLFGKVDPATPRFILIFMHVSMLIMIEEKVLGRSQTIIDIVWFA